jgi:RNA processing factor Prp31
MNEEVQKVLADMDSVRMHQEIFGDRVQEWRSTIRTELTRLTEFADQYEPLVVRLGEVTTKLEALVAMRNRWVRDAREHLNTFGQHMPASLECLVEQFDAALRGKSE